jgi:hypothetical protein
MASGEVPYYGPRGFLPDESQGKFRFSFFLLWPPSFFFLQVDKRVRIYFKAKSASYSRITS